jgi:plastocyanin
MKRPAKLIEWIDRYTHGELAGDELSEFLEYMESHPAVRAESDLDRQLTDFLHDPDRIAFQETLTLIMKKRRGPSYRSCLLLAASLLTLILLGSLWVTINPLEDREEACDGNKFREKKNSQENIKYGPAEDMRGIYAWKKITEYKNAYAERNYLPFIYMESLVGVSLRSQPIVLVEPEAVRRISPGDPVSFIWKGTMNDTVTIMLYDNCGRKLREKMCRNNSMKLHTRDIPPGLYYWKMTYDSSLITVGKLVVR